MSIVYCGSGGVCFCKYTGIDALKVVKCKPGVRIAEVFEGVSEKVEWRDYVESMETPSAMDDTDWNITASASSLVNGTAWRNITDYVSTAAGESIASDAANSSSTTSYEEFFAKLADDALWQVLHLATSAVCLLVVLVIAVAGYGLYRLVNMSTFKFAHITLYHLQLYNEALYI